MSPFLLAPAADPTAQMAGDIKSRLRAKLFGKSSSSNGKGASGSKEPWAGESKEAATATRKTRKRSTDDSPGSSSSKASSSSRNPSASRRSTLVRSLKSHDGGFSPWRTRTPRPWTGSRTTEGEAPSSSSPARGGQPAAPRRASFIFKAGGDSSSSSSGRRKSSHYGSSWLAAPGKGKGNDNDGDNSHGNHTLGAAAGSAVDSDSLASPDRAPHGSGGPRCESRSSGSISSGSGGGAATAIPPVPPVPDAARIPALERLSGRGVNHRGPADSSDSLDDGADVRTRAGLDAYVDRQIGKIHQAEKKKRRDDVQGRAGVSGGEEEDDEDEDEVLVSRQGGRGSTGGRSSRGPRLVDEGQVEGVPGTVAASVPDEADDDVDGDNDHDVLKPSQPGQRSGGCGQCGRCGDGLRSPQHQRRPSAPRPPEAPATGSDQRAPALPYAPAAHAAAVSTIAPTTTTTTTSVITTNTTASPITTPATGPITAPSSDCARLQASFSSLRIDQDNPSAEADADADHDDNDIDDEDDNHRIGRGPRGVDTLARLPKHRVAQLSPTIIEPSTSGRAHLAVARSSTHQPLGQFQRSASPLPLPINVRRPSAPPRRQSILPVRQTKLINALLSSSVDHAADDSDADSIAPSFADTAALHPISGTMVTRKIWVKRPLASATLITINEDDLVDDVRDLILRKYANSLGRQFDSPDITLRICPRDREREPSRMLQVDEPMGRTLDAYFPGGQAVDEALLIDVPGRRTPKASPNPRFYQADDRPHESGTDYFPPYPPPPGAHSHSHLSQSHHAPSSNASLTAQPTHSTHLPPSMTIVGGGQLPPLPSPGSMRRLAAPSGRPRMSRMHTASPVSTTTANSHGSQSTSQPAQQQQGHVRPNRSRTHSAASSEHSSNHPPPAVAAPPMPSPPAQPERVATPPPRVSSPRTVTNRAKKMKKPDAPSLPPGLLNGSVPPINVLIVEDNIINLKLLEAFVKRLKVRWQTAVNGKEAVDKWRAGGFHLVLMDIQLPIMNGLDATREIRRIEKVNSIGVFSSSASSAPEEPAEIAEQDKLVNTEMFKSPVIIVALTASSLQSDRHEALAAGCNDFLTKPVNFVWLERKVMEWGCMQALIDFDGWRKWKDFSQKSQENEASKKAAAAAAAAKAKAKKHKAAVTPAAA